MKTDKEAEKLSWLVGLLVWVHIRRATCRLDSRENMVAADPSYPLFPIFSFVAAILLLFVMTLSLIRQRYNLGVAFLCFWLFVDNVTSGIDAIVWSDNADVKLSIYCDIGKSTALVAQTSCGRSDRLCSQQFPACK